MTGKPTVTFWRLGAHPHSSLPGDRVHSPIMPITAAVPGLPQSIIMNGQGYYGDCQLNPAGGAALLPCNVSAVTVKPDESQQQPWASASNPGD